MGRLRKHVKHPTKIPNDRYYTHTLKFLVEEPVSVAACYSGNCVTVYTICKKRGKP